jgi:hypothetical protein
MAEDAYADHLSLLAAARRRCGGGETEVRRRRGGDGGWILDELGALFWFTMTETRAQGKEAMMSTSRSVFTLAVETDTHHVLPIRSVFIHPSRD